MSVWTQKEELNIRSRQSKQTPNTTVWGQLVLEQTDLCSFMAPEEVLKLQQRTVNHIPNGDLESFREAKLCLKRLSWRKGKTYIFLKVFHKNCFNALLALEYGKDHGEHPLWDRKWTQIWHKIILIKIKSKEPIFGYLQYAKCYDRSFIFSFSIQRAHSLLLPPIWLCVINIDVPPPPSHTTSWQHTYTATQYNIGDQSHQQIKWAPPNPTLKPCLKHMMCHYHTAGWHVSARDTSSCLITSWAQHNVDLFSFWDLRIYELDFYHKVIISRLSSLLFIVKIYYIIH